MKKVYRHEKKYMINPQQKRVITSRLEKLCKGDPFADENNTYRVSSLYFDDYINSGIEDKLTGNLKRKKFRIRIYNGKDDVIKLERKAKNGNMCLKDAVRISKDEYNAIMNDDIEYLKDNDNAVVRDFYLLYRNRRLRPRVIVDYMRQCFIFSQGNVRVTMDSDLHTSVGKCDLFSQSSFIPVLEKDQIVLEVKYTGFLPSVIRDMVQHGSGNMESISKYTYCRSSF
ncbi:MAG TPA: polyphosphate polymerase domain-containing protein [Thermotogota bacterium]|nr:polyphosphate polymerase domain-containing protein [Thermotogota bacterium]HPJ88733.1 polyphosphate polymerase domain-containing protein [Thermotogota bacterium]HPR97185.1 polyphosphate polymerase domain-containing protein [Thermotogota bacterium]